MEGSTEVGLEEVGSRGYCRIEVAEVGAGMVGRAGRPDCSTSSFSVLSWTTKLVLWKSSTMLGYSSGNLYIVAISAAFQQKFGGTDLDGRELVTETF